MDKKHLHIYDRRAMLSLDYGMNCGFGCRYCFSPSIEPVNRIRDLSEVMDELRARRGEFDIVGAGCEQELFLNPKKAMEFLRRLTDLGKIIGFSTKTHLSKGTVSELQGIDGLLKADDAYLFLQVSFVSGADRPDIEPYAPSVEGRIDNLRMLAEGGIYTGTLIRPVLPDEVVPVAELMDLIGRTKDSSHVFTLGDFYYNESIRRRMRMQDPGTKHPENVTHDIKLEFLKGGCGLFDKYIDHEKKSLLEAYIRYLGRRVYDTTTESVLSFRASP